MTRSEGSRPVIELRHLTKRYGPILAVDDLSFTVAAGQVTGFLGPNGSGKSTTMRMIVGLDAPTAGQVTVAGRSYGRLRFYSYDFLENLAGCDIHSADRIIPRWQDIKIGDEVKLAPAVGLDVVALEPGRSLVLRGGVAMGITPPPYDFTWAWVLHDQPDGTSRLRLRERYAYTRPWARFLVEPVEAVSFVMSQKMLRGIRNRAQQVTSEKAPFRRRGRYHRWDSMSR
jgi:energy-coupling factor transporter ATP-binding protein EcfA2